MEKFKGPILVTGSRSLATYDTFCRLIKGTGWTITQIIHGGAKGVDALAARYCRDHQIKEVVVPADWIGQGKAAGPLRNIDMCNTIKELNGKVFAWWDNSSKGCKQCVDYAESIGLEVYLCVTKPKDNYTIETLLELQKRLENAKLINADTARNLIRQLIETKKEYIQVAQDTKIMWNALQDAGPKGKTKGELPYDAYMIDAQMVETALETPTAKYLEKQNETTS